VGSDYLDEQRTCETGAEEFDIQALRGKLDNMEEWSKLPSNTNILEYWESQKVTEPILYRISKVILGCPAAQVTVERSFNNLTLILTFLRTRLSDENVDNLMVVHENIDLIDKIKF
jgi:hypothetical protein